jgi:hypothetical protein
VVNRKKETAGVETHQEPAGTRHFADPARMFVTVIGKAALRTLSFA